MLPKTIKISLMAFLVIFAGAVVGQAQSIDREYEYSDDDYERVKIDRHLDVEVWTDHYDGEYYNGDDIVVYFRANRDAFVSIYSIDTRGRVNLLFPIDPTEDNYVRGGVTYSLPGEDADYDLEINGPEGFENIQIIASRERFDIPNWYRNSGLVCDWDDRADYMDYLNASHFVRYSGQRFAYDRAVIYVNEWEPNYYRPIYRPYYPSWTVYGNCYIDYPFGASVYVNGIYWGCAPLYVPRISVGWHVVTIYDYYGHCWESDFHVSRYNTVVFDRSVVVPSASVRSKYKEVRLAGFRDPIKNGYPNFKAKKTVINNNVTINNSTKVVNKSSSKNTVVNNTSRKYVRGSTKLVKTNRGYETDAAAAVVGSKIKQSRTGSTSRTQNSVKQTTTGSSSKSTGKSSKTSSGTYKSTSSNKSSSSSGYYQKKSGSSSKRSSGSSKSSSRSGGSSKTVKKQSSSSSSSSSSSTGTYKKQSSSSKSSGTPRVKSQKTTKSSSSSTKSSSDKKVKSSSSTKSSGTPKATKKSTSSKSGGSKKKVRR